MISSLSGSIKPGLMLGLLGCRQSKTMYMLLIHCQVVLRGLSGTITGDSTGDPSCLSQYVVDMVIVLPTVLQLTNLVIVSF